MYSWPDPEFTVEERVGIGTLTPSEALDAVGNIAATGDISSANLTVSNAIATSEVNATGTIRANLFEGDGSALTGTSKWSDGSSGNIFYNNGNVGIGTNNPTSHLTVSGSIDLTGDIRLRGRDIRDAGDTPRITINDNGRLDLKEDNGVIALSINTNGNVGIGTTNPTRRLTVNGDMSVISGNVGIGTTTPTNRLTVDGNMNVTGDISADNLNLIGGSNQVQFTREILQEGFGPDSTNNLKLSLSRRQNFGEAAPTYELWVGHPAQRVFNAPAVNIFRKQLTVNSNGNVFVAEELSCRNLRVRSGNKSGYVSDHFVNAVGEPVEQGDVVVLSDHPVSRFCATENDIPIPEVDLTDRAYDTRICGIVAKVTTEDGLPFVENEASQIPPEILAQIQPEDRQEKVSLEDIPKEIIESIQLPHPLRSLAATTEEGLNTKLVKDQQMGSMVTMGCFSYCKVDADIAAIAVGDLLTTSPTKGHAQKVLELERATGSIIGKALSPLDKGKGKIPVLVMLQ